jgi:glutamate racemase
MLGFFDSGLGGITVLRRVRELLPLHDMVFFADQAHVPYGDRDVPELLQLIAQNLHLLDDMRVDAIVAACNTSCALSATYGWPPVRAVVLDLIESAAMALERTGAKRIGVFATAPTARSGAYAKHILARIPDAHVTEVAAPALVPLVEAGKLDDAQTREAVRAVCEELGGGVEAIVLGCTHYPLLMDHFAAILGPGVTIVDPALVQAKRTAALARRLGIPPGTGRLECLTNGDAIRFEASVRRLLDAAHFTVHSVVACPGQNPTLSR